MKANKKWRPFPFYSVSIEKETGETGYMNRKIFLFPISIAAYTLVHPLFSH